MPVLCEYTVFDAEKQDLKLVTATGWRDAVFTAYNRFGFLPRNVNHVRPRTGTCSTPESVEVFEGFMSTHF